MKLTYDRETDSLYIEVVARPSARTEEIAPGVLADFDTEGKLVGLDVEDASETFELGTVEVEVHEPGQPASVVTSLRDWLVKEQIRR